ncbi:MAG: DUF86 domain-containing protein [Parcubacteria group bacterium]|nr:DUF86 domain-containing protein [Parcubacteria group bacterium]
MEKDELYLRHILDAITAIESYTSGIGFDEFLKNKLLQDGIIRELEIIGEASKNLSQDFKDKHNVIPWRKIMSNRDRLIHEYFGVSLKAVWQTLEQDLPKLKEQVKDILN